MDTFLLIFRGIDDVNLKKILNIIFDKLTIGDKAVS